MDAVPRSEEGSNTGRRQDAVLGGLGSCFCGFEELRSGDKPYALIEGELIWLDIVDQFAGYAAVKG
jgi:hypothetical protein